MNHDPWMDTVWSERQVAWCLAGLPELHYEAGKVEGEIDDSSPEMGAHPEAFETYLASGNPRDLFSRRPVVVSPPTLSGPTAEGEPAYEQLELLRKAVRFRRLHPADGLVIYWDRVRGYWNRTHIDDMPEDAEPIRFKVETGELARWMEREGMAFGPALARKYGAVRASVSSEPTGSQPNDASHEAFYIAALRLAWAGGTLPKTKTEFNLKLQTSDIKGLPGEKTLRVAFDRAKEGGEIDYPDYVPPSARGCIVALFKYAAGERGESLKGAAPTQIHRVLVELLTRHDLPVPEKDAWEAIGLL